jgi:MFS family permease
VFVRGHPRKFGYASPNPEKPITAVPTMKERFITLWKGLLQVLVYPYFWCVTAYAVLATNPILDLSGMWISPMLQHIYGFFGDQQGAANTAIAISVGMIIGSLTLPAFSTFIETRKWTMAGLSAVCFATSLIFLLLEPIHITVPVLWILLIIMSGCSNSVIGICYPLLNEYYPPAVAGTAVGFANLFTFLISAIYQQISTEIIRSYGTQKLDPPPSTDVYTWEGYRYGCWLFFTISWALAVVVAAIAKDATFGKQETPKKPDKEVPDIKDEGESD